jgi:hypothetical protein
MTCQINYISTKKYLVETTQKTKHLNSLGMFINENLGRTLKHHRSKEKLSIIVNTEDAHRRTETISPSCVRLVQFMKRE